MKKKVLGAILCSGLAVSMLAGCGSKTEETTAAAETTAAETAAETEAKAEAEETTKAEETTEAAADGESDLAYVADKGTLIVGITNFEPMDYKDENGEWIGFDADLARKFAESIGAEAEFIEIDWDNKILELDSKNIDCVWNGMTLTDEVLSAMECSRAYLNNAQVVVVPSDKAADYQTVESLKDLSFAAEAGSAGEAELTNLGLNVTPVTAQSDALLEVASGTCDAAAIDSLMAAAMIGEGTSYADLTYTVALNSEEYGVGFRKGSDLAEALNTYFDEAAADGSLEELAEQYGVQAALVDAK